MPKRAPASPERTCTACGTKLGAQEGAWFFEAFLCAPCLEAAKSQVGLN